MSHFDLLEKRHHVRRYTDEIPPRYVVEHALCKHGKQHHLKTMQCLQSNCLWIRTSRKEKSNTRYGT